MKFIDLSHSAAITGKMRNILEENGYVVVSGVLGDANVKQAMKLAGDFLGAAKRAEQSLSGDSSVSWPRVVEGLPPSERLFTFVICKFKFYFYFAFRRHYSFLWLGAFFICVVRSISNPGRSDILSTALWGPGLDQQTHILTGRRCALE